MDWYHAWPYLYAAGQVASSTDTPHNTHRIEADRTLLYQGRASVVADHVETLVSSLKPQAADLVRSAAYFRNNVRRMNYLEARENGWLIGSGSIESGCKQFQAHLKALVCAGLALARSECCS